MMRNKIVISIALALSIAAISLIGSDSRASAQRNRTYFYDSGVVQLGPNQTLIGLLVPAALAQNENIPVRVTKVQYAQVSCNDSLCKDQIASQNLFDDVIISSLRDSMTQSPTSSGIRIVFSSNNPNLRANGQILDTVSGAVISTFSFGASQVGN